MRILQVCNVGRIVGGTAACAWTVTRALPECEHHVVFLSQPTPETRSVFQPGNLHHWPQVDARRLQTIRPDLVILHNTPASRCQPIETAATLRYVHSHGRHAAADHTVYCSRWLADECRAEGPDSTTASRRTVLHQAVPKPIREASHERRRLGESPIVGRLCTPTTSKWPETLVAFYADRSRRHPGIEWEFVGCPESMIPSLRAACAGRARFHPAAWRARSHLWRWDALLYHHPTLTESFGRTAAEALRAGCVPIVDDRGGFREQITPETGRLCARAEDFDDSLEELKDWGLQSALSRSAMEHGDRLFSIAAFRARLWTVMRVLSLG